MKENNNKEMSPKSCGDKPKEAPKGTTSDKNKGGNCGCGCGTKK